MSTPAVAPAAPLDGVVAPPSQLPFRPGTSEQFAQLRDYLARSGYTPDEITRCAQAGREIRERLGDEAANAAIAAAASSDTSRLLQQLFLSGESIPWSEVRSIVPAPELELLLELGFLRTHPTSNGLCFASLMLYPTASLYLVSDREGVPQECLFAPGDDFVYPAVTPETFRFMTMLPQSPCEAFLELCAGTGVAALTAAAGGFAGHAWALDITERSTRFAAYNAALNELHNVTALRSDLYEAVRGQTFDRIVAHPPYVPSAKVEFIFRDGGSDGEQVTRRIIQELPDFLRPGGRFYCSCMSTDRKNAPLESRLRALLGPRQDEFDILLIEMHPPASPPIEFFVRRAREAGKGFGDLEVIDRAYQELGVERLVLCTMVIQRRTAPRPVFTARRRAGPATATRQVEWAMAWETADTHPGIAQALLESRPVVSPTAQVALLTRLSEGQFVPASSNIQISDPFEFDADGPPWLAFFLARCDGQTTVRQLLADMREAGEAPPELSDTELEDYTEQLVGAGVLGVGSLRVTAPARPQPAAGGAS